MRNNHRNTARLLAGAALATAAITGLSQPAQATPSTLGFYPSTDIYGGKVVHLDVDTYGVALKTNIANTVGLTYGIGTQDKAFGRAEIGFDYLTNGSDSSDTVDRLIGNAKVLLYNSPDSTTRAVAGAWLLGNDDLLGANVLYLAGSKAFDFGRVTVGLAHALEEDLVGGDDADDTYLQLGYDRALSKRLLFAADFYSGKSTISGVQPTLYYSVNDRASFGIGYFRLNDEDFGRQNQTYICFDYNFGGGVETPQEAAPAQGQPGAPGDAAPAPATP